MTKLGDYDIAEILNGYDSEMDGLESDNENELDVQTKNDVFPIEELQRLMNEFDVEDSLETEMDQYETNLTEIEPVNQHLISTNMQQNTLMVYILPRKKYVMAKKTFSYY